MGLCFHCWWAVCGVHKWSGTSWPAGRVHLLVHYTISLSIIMETYLKVLNFSNSCQVYSVDCVSRIKSRLSLIFCSIHGAACFQLTIPLWWSWEYVLYLIIITKSGVWIINQCLVLDLSAAIPQQILIYYQLDPGKQSSVQVESKYKNINWKKYNILNPVCEDFHNTLHSIIFVRIDQIQWVKVSQHGPVYTNGLFQATRQIQSQS